ncbi:MAG: hypothetical protein HRT87_07480 [Legionellales bacterium]|nr:hypothetical protein [Legionellales bacterium]
MKKIISILIVAFSLNSYSQQFTAEEKRYFGFHAMHGFVSNIAYKEVFNKSDLFSYSANFALTNTISIINKDKPETILLNNLFNLGSVWLSNKLLNNYHKTEKQKAHDKLKLIYNE